MCSVGVFFLVPVQFQIGFDGSNWTLRTGMARHGTWFDFGVVSCAIKSMHKDSVKCGEDVWCTFCWVQINAVLTDCCARRKDKVGSLEVNSWAHASVRPARHTPNTRPLGLLGALYHFAIEKKVKVRDRKSLFPICSLLTLIGTNDTQVNAIEGMKKYDS